MNNDVLYESLSTASNRYYDSKSSIQSSPVGVIRPTVEVHAVAEKSSHHEIDVCETIIQRGCDIIKV